MSRGGSLISSRKGMSPLIATVLLMAFAVALGGMIMNWSVDSTKGGDCERINLHVGKLCTQDGKIFLTVRNDPQSVQLNGIKMLLTEGIVENVISIKDTKLTPGQPLEISFPAQFSKETKIAIMGIIGSDANPITCSEPIVPSQQLTQCG